MDYKKVFDLTEKVAVITGGTGGLGREMGIVLGSYGASIALVAKNKERGEDLLKVYQSMGMKGSFIETDVTREDSVREMKERVLEEYGRVDILINGAGTNIWQKAEEYTVENWDLVMDINVKGTFLCCRELGLPMIERRRGKIINISSVRSKLGFPADYTAYCASKGAINSYTKCLAAEWAKYSINVNAIAPTFIRTPLTESMLSDQETYRSLIQRIPLQRIGAPQDLSGAILFFASEASDFITGQILFVDGGITATQ